MAIVIINYTTDQSNFIDIFSINVLHSKNQNTHPQSLQTAGFLLLFPFSPELSWDNLHWFAVGHLLFLLFLWRTQLLWPHNPPSCWCHHISNSLSQRLQTQEPLTCYCFTLVFFLTKYNWCVCTRWVTALTNQYQTHCSISKCSALCLFIWFPHLLTIHVIYFFKE